MPSRPIRWGAASRTAPPKRRRTACGASEQKAHTDENRNDSSHVFVRFCEVSDVANEEGDVGECQTVAGDNPICARPDDQLCDLFFHSLVAFVRYAGEAFPTDGHGAAFIQDNSVGFVTDAHDFAPWLNIPQMGIVLINLTEHLEQFSDIIGGRWEHGDQVFNEPVILIGERNSCHDLEDVV